MQPGPVRGLYAIVDQAAAAARGWTVPDLAAAYLDGGARWLQLRAPGAAGGELLDWCDAVVELARHAGAFVVVNDRVDLAALSGAAGVHLGQTDLAPAAARELLPSGALVGWSTHTLSEVEAAVRLPIDYVAVGPVFATATKASSYAPVGLSRVREAKARFPELPVVAIGGITLARVRDVLGAGADAVAVIGDLMAGDRPDRRVAAYTGRLADCV